MHYLRSLPYVNGKVGIFGTCSGGRHAYLAACRVPGFDAIIDCWGGRVVMRPDELNDKFPVASIDYTKDLSCPILGIFGNDDTSPTPEQVDQHEVELKKHGKIMNFTGMMAPGMDSSITSMPLIARRKPWMAGRRSLRFWRSI